MTFKNFEATLALKNSMEEKLSHLTRHFRNITHADCVFRIDHNDHIVHLLLTGENLRLFSVGISSDMYDSIQKATQKLEKQLYKTKEKVQNHNNGNHEKGETMHLEERKTEQNGAYRTLSVRDLMTPKPFTIYEDDNLQLAEDMMQWRYIRHIPVIDHEGNLVGLLTHRDLLKASVSALAKFKREEMKRLNLMISAKDIMQKQVVTVSPEAQIQEAADLMLGNKFGCLPVVKKGKLIGIITEADFVKYVCS